MIFQTFAGVPGSGIPLSMRKLSLGAFFGLCLAVLALNFFVIGPALLKSSELAGNLTFILVRLGVILAFAFVAGRFYGRARWDTIRLGSLLEFFDHVVYRSIAFALDYRSNPGSYLGVEKSQMVMAVAFPFMIAFPIIVILCLVAGEVGRGLRARAANGTK